MKIYNRKKLIWNLISFVILSFIFVYVEKCISIDKSAFSKELFFDFFLSQKYLVFFSLISLIGLYKVYKISQLFLFIYINCVVYESFSMLFPSFSKIIFFMVFLYIVMAYYFFFYWRHELSGPFYNPCYRDSDFELGHGVLIKVDLIFLNNLELGKEGVLSNWSESGCFIRFKEKITLAGTSVLVKINFGGRVFEQEGVIYTSDDHLTGIGIEFKQSKTDIYSPFNWEELYSILFDLGYVPNHLI